MNKREKKKFLRGLSREIVSNLCRHVDHGHVPRSWDGFYLRELLARAFDLERMPAMRDKREARAIEYARRINSYDEPDLFRTVPPKLTAAQQLTQRMERASK